MAKKKTVSGQRQHHKKNDMISSIFEIYQSRIDREKVIKCFEVDYDAVRLKRRISAAGNLMPKVKGIVLSMWPDIPDELPIEADWAHTNAQLLSTYDQDERDCATILGAAIWILDQLRECGKLAEVVRLLPKDKDTLDAEDLPPVRDPYYSEDILRGMVFILRNRNADCENRVNDDRDIEEFPVFMDQNTARKKHRQKVQSRLLFETVLGYIPEENKRAAAQEYENDFWEWVRRYYRCWMIYHKKRVRILQEQERLEELRIRRTAAGVMPSSGRNLDYLHMLDRDPEEEKLDDDYYSISNDILSLRLELSSGGVNSAAELETEFGEDIAALWDGFSIRDPYRHCFAFLYLLDSGSDLPWLYFPGMCLFHWYAARLPWGSFDTTQSREYRFSDDDVLSQMDLTNPENWYELQFEENLEPGHVGYRNLAQIIYNSTGCLIPRAIKHYPPVFPVLEYYGQAGEFAANSLEYIMSMLEVVCRRTEYLALEEEPEAPDTVVEETADTESAEELQSRISVMKGEIAALKQSLAEMRRELRAEKKKSAEIGEKYALEHQELSDLRTLVFHQSEDTYQSDVPGGDVALPYTAVNNIVVFGGHDSWLREIRQKLDHVRFVGRDQLPNAELIRNADMVWIQPNSLSHAFFYRIINEVRKYKIPLRYFTYKGAIKCAEELAAADKKYTPK